MINLFKFSSEDLSLTYLKNIFGSMNGIIPGSDSGLSISILGTMFKTFNSIALVVAVLIVVYVTVVSVVSTAHEGKFMGKFHSMWIPLRMVLGITCLVPTGSGYSGLQLIMMWVIVQGVGAADTLWKTTLSYIDVIGSPYQEGLLPSLGVSNALGELYKGLVCDASSKMTQPDPQQVGINYYCGAVKGSGFCAAGASYTPFTPNYSNPTYTLGPQGNCGAMTYCNLNEKCSGVTGSGTVTGADSLACAACKGQIQALTMVIPVLGGIATQFAQDDYHYREFIAKSWNQTNAADWGMVYDYCQANNIPQSQCCVKRQQFVNGKMVPITLQNCQSTASGPNGTFPAPYVADNQPYAQYSASIEAVRQIYYPYSIEKRFGKGNFVNTAVSQYMDTIGSAITTYILAHGQGNLSTDLAEIEKQGWIMAGASYLKITTKFNNNFDQINVPIGFNPPPSGNPIETGYRNNVQAANALLAAVRSQNNDGASTSAASLSPQMSQVTAGYGNAVSDLGNIITSPPNKKDNPLIGLQRVGYALFITAETMFWVAVVIFVATAIGGGISVFALGTGATNPVAAGVFMLFSWFGLAYFAIMAYMITIGGMLGVYVPLIPFIMFSTGVVGWFITTIEAIAAGPLVALGIMMPSGHHEVLGKSEHALNHMLHIFLRPALMIVGLIAGMAMASVMVDFITTGFSMASSKLTVKKDMIGLIILLVVKVGLIVTVLNKCFSAIHLVPSKVFSWIGGTASEYGESEGVSAMKGSSEAGAGGVKGAASAGVAKGSQQGEAYAAKVQANKANKGGAGLGADKPTDTDTGASPKGEGGAGEIGSKPGQG